MLSPWRHTPGGASGIYSCTSRAVGGQFIFGPEEREEFVRLMRCCEQFFGVHILDYTVLSNHFHIEVEVPPPPAKPLSDREFLKRLAALYPSCEVDKVRRRIRRCRERDDDEGAENAKEKFTRRMWDLSEFMKSLKQRFSRYYNNKHDRHGTLWEERFKSVLVQHGYAARVVAAYIGLNAVRAGIVEDPKDYRWSAYGAALGGDLRAREGLRRLMNQATTAPRGAVPPKDWRQCLADYRVALYLDGKQRSQVNPVTGEPELVDRGFSAEEVRKVLEEGGQLSLAQMLRLRVRYFSDGVALGSESFLEDLFKATRGCFSPRRERGALPIPECEEDLCVMHAVKDGLPR